MLILSDSIGNTERLINDGTYVFHFVEAPSKSWLLCMIHILTGHCVLVIAELFLSNTLRTIDDFRSPIWLGITQIFFDHGFL